MEKIFLAVENLFILIMVDGVYIEYLAAWTLWFCSNTMSHFMWVEISEYQELNVDRNINCICLLKVKD